MRKLYGWKDRHTSADDRIIEYGGALRFIVKPGDNPIGSTGERSELLGMTPSQNDENGSQGISAYRYSFILPQGWRDTSHWCIGLQLHGPNGNPSNASSPSFAVDFSRVPGRTTLVLNGGEVKPGQSNIKRKNVDLGAHEIGGWVTLVFVVKWSASDGYIQVLKASEGENLTPLTTVIHPNLYCLEGVPQMHYWKRGLYRNAEDFTSELWSDPLVRIALEPGDSGWRERV